MSNQLPETERTYCFNYDDMFDNLGSAYLEFIFESDGDESTLLNIPMTTSDIPMVVDVMLQAIT